jgi:hypothetical protein
MTRRRSGASRRWAILASAVVAVAFLGLAVADAAQLNVTGSGVAVASAARCTNGPVAIAGGATHSGSSYASVSLANLAAACSGQAIQVTVYDASQAALATGTGTAGTAPFDITTTSFNATLATGVALLVGTWGVPTTWTALVLPVFTCVATDNAFAPVVPAEPCTIKSISITNGTTTTGGVTYRTVTATFRVNSPAAHLRFLVTADFGVTTPLPAAFPGWTPVSVAINTLTAQTPSVCGSLPLFTARGVNNRANGSRTFTIYGTERPAFAGGYTLVCTP